MYSTAFSMPAAAALAAGTLVLSSAVSAHATESTSSGKATAAVLRAGLDVSLLSKSADVPLNVSLSDVHAPADSGRTALTARLDAVDHGRPFSVLRAEVATARATADGRKAEGYVNVVGARVNVPGLPLLGLIKAETITSRATCEVGKPPVAESNLLGRVSVLGKRVTLSAGGPTKVTVPGIGEVRLDLSKRETTSRTAAATALVLTVAVDPLNLNVAEVTGRVTLAAATCETPGGAGTESSSGTETASGNPGNESASGTETAPSAGTEARAQNVATTDATEQNLADTGGSAATQYLAAGAAGLLAAGSLVAYAARRRRPAPVDVKD
ncbi:hypothetical protein OG607_35955 [Streptomyces sp. NBC_01537]|uniref:SCO1860 family LAETG-anchored protein n=1 Tax=Streptomyces sp. NBC_01537 TaxID=2903896 RepID=UPI00386C0DDE